MLWTGTYRPNADEITVALKRMKLFKSSLAVKIIETVLLAFAAVYWGAEFVVIQSYSTQTSLALISLVLIPIIWGVPYFTIRKRARELAQGAEISFEIQDDALLVGQGENRWTIPLDQSTELFFEPDFAIVFQSYKQKSFVVPKRAFGGEATYLEVLAHLKTKCKLSE